MRSPKNRSRGNKNRNRPSGGGNIVNRVFDSSGPEGKVRGTPQQIIEKYTQLHRDAVLSGDRVNAENFAQHAEHYLRMLAEAQREIEAKRLEQEEQNRQRQAERDRERERERERNEQRRAAQAEEAAAAEGASELVDTPENKGGGDDDKPKGSDQNSSEQPAPDKPRRRTRPRKSVKAPENDEKPGADAPAKPEPAEDPATAAQ